MKCATLFAALLQLAAVQMAAAVPLVSQAEAHDSLQQTETTAEIAARQASSWWLAGVKHQGTVAYGGQSGYQVFRNVKDFGAKGDGSTDDTAAINAAISSGNRCGNGCDSSTLTPALVYFPPGTYIVSRPVVAYYYSQLVGDAVSPPTIKATPGFQGIGLIDVDPYNSDGSNWYTNQNNFYRQIRNFVIDTTAMPQSAGTGIHWQVAQATSLENIRFEMVRGGGSNNKQQGIFMDNGSGGFMADLVFNGGGLGAFFGNQQFTTRNLTFNGCNTGVFMNWNWLWAFKSVTFNGCAVGLDMSNNPSNQTVGSITLQDSKVVNTPIGVKTAWTQSTPPVGGGTLILDNVDFSGAQQAVAGVNGNTILAGGSVVSSWGQGQRYQSQTKTRFQSSLSAPAKPAALLQNGKFFERSKPRYTSYTASNFISLKSKGAKGDGVTDDTAAIQAAMNSIGSNQVLFIDHGAYVVSNTIKVPANIRIVGEIWPLIMAKGSAFQDESNPRPVWQIGQPGDVGAVEMQDLVFETVGPQPGAILMEWNVAGSSQGAVGAWDVHFRVGGSAGTQLSSDTCAKNPGTVAGPNANCRAAFMLVHVTKTSSPYIENSHMWVADHDLDRADHNQINIYNGRGILIESTKGAWLYGTAAEHSQMYNYNLFNAQNVYMSFIQTETAYMQTNPDATVPFKQNSAYNDPTFQYCASGDTACKKTWGLKINSSSNIFVYGAGLYSFFQNYGQDCIGSNTCQTNMVSTQQSSNVYLYGLSTVGTKNMVLKDGVAQVPANDNRSNFCSTIALWQY